MRRPSVVSLLVCALSVLQGVGTAFGQETAFSAASLEGSYAFTLTGSLIDRLESTEIRVAAVGRLTADGNGNLTRVTRTIKWGGQTLQQVAVGTYQINPDGTGTALLNVSTVGGEGRLTPALIEAVSFVLTGDAGQFESLVTDWWGPDGKELTVSPVVRLVATKQTHGAASPPATLILPPLPPDPPGDLEAQSQVDDAASPGIPSNLDELERQLRRDFAEAGMPPQEIEEKIRELRPQP